MKLEPCVAYKKVTIIDLDKGQGPTVISPSLLMLLWLPSNKNDGQAQ